MESFTVHGIPGSPFLRAALLGLEEKSLPYTIAALPFGGHKTPEYRTIHPFGRIPAMDHGDFRLYETQAMLRSMDRIAPSPPMVPTDEARIADALPRAQICVDVVAGSMGDQKFMAGDALSLADLTIVPHLAYFAQTEEGRAMMAPHANLMAWLDRMNTRPSMVKTTAERSMGG